MTLEEYDQRIRHAINVQIDGDKLAAAGRALESELYRDAGIEWHTRDPGFPCCAHNALPGYYNSPREVVEALEAK